MFKGLPNWSDLICCAMPYDYRCSSMWPEPFTVCECRVCAQASPICSRSINSRPQASCLTAGAAALATYVPIWCRQVRFTRYEPEICMACC